MTNLSWKYCQNNSDLILSTGNNELTKQIKKSFSNSYPKEYGNYLISNTTENWNYIGEAINLSIRLRQHSKDNTSTFFKNYNKLSEKHPNLPKGLQIKDFQISTIFTKIGRKEIEEFGIVNIPTNLNKFQKGKRQEYSGKTDLKIWQEVQTKYQNLLEEGESEMLNSKSYKWFDANVESTAGLYWIEHQNKGLIYIGESSNIRERHKTHSGTTYFSALRRHIGENILQFQLQKRNGKKRYFEENEDIKVTQFLNACTFKPLAVNFGRYELEEYLIKKHNPLLNRKGNKKVQVVTPK